jgi:hypothetical protein
MRVVGTLLMLPGVTTGARSEVRQSMTASSRTRTARRLAAAGLVVLGLAAGCADVTEPRAPVELLPQRYTFGPCGGGWTPATPPVTRTVVDIRLVDDGRATGPAPPQVAAVERAGGRILRRFNIGMVRAELDVQAVPSLFGRDGVANYVETVTDLTRHDVMLIVFLSRDLTDAHIAAVESIGGRVESRLDALEGYIVEISDDAVPQVRALPDVQSVGANSYGCLA